MADTKALVSMAQQFTGLPMKDLIGAPLIAAAEANNAMSISQTRFLLDHCFHNHKEANTVEELQPVMLQTEVNKVNEIAESSEVPLLTALPLKAIADNEEENSENMMHSMRCPVCTTGTIHYDFRLLIQGSSFPCDNSECGANISLSHHSQKIAADTVDKLQQISQ